MTFKHSIFSATLLLFLVLTACRNEDFIFIPETVHVTQPQYTEVDGFYLLNEGRMGANQAALDYYNYATGTYTRNIYEEANPNVVMELGDVGNDLAIYGNRLYVVLNCSNKVEVLDKRTAKRIGQVNIFNCRNIKFHDGYAYVTSYVGPVVLPETGKDDEVYQLGAVFKVDTTTLAVVDSCFVGRQPDELDIVDNKIYVANSGGYSMGVGKGYERTVSVIDIKTFKEEERIDLGINLQYCRADRRGILWVSSRGDYKNNKGCLFAYNIYKRRIEKTFDFSVSSMCMEGDSLYAVCGEWSDFNAGYSDTKYKIINTRSLAVDNEMFITDGTDTKIKRPYGIAVNPVTKEIYIADARQYVSPGTLYCFSPEGVAQWNVRTGYVPAHFFFLGKTINN